MFRGGGAKRSRRQYRAPSSDRQDDILPNSHQSLVSTLRGLDSQAYGRYQALCGIDWNYPSFTLRCIKAQKDPFAPPSMFTVRVEPTVSGFPEEFICSKLRRTALADYLARNFSAFLAEGKNSTFHKGGHKGGGWGGEKGGAINMVSPNQYVLERTSVMVAGDGTTEARFTIELPARGRSIMGALAASTFSDVLPKVVEKLFFENNVAEALWNHITCVEDQEYLRSQLECNNLVAFISNGALLPRQSGDSHLPLDNSNDVVPFVSVPELEREFILPHKGKITGMGIPSGVTLILGGGFHGKSTLLEAIQYGVYNKVLGDGREYVVSISTSLKVRVEDGRSVCACDISPFLNGLPNQKSVNIHFSKN